MMSMRSVNVALWSSYLQLCLEIPTNADSIVCEDILDLYSTGLQIPFLTETEIVFGMKLVFTSWPLWNHSQTNIQRLSLPSLPHTLFEKHLTLEQKVVTFTSVASSL